MEGQIWCSYRK